VRASLLPASAAAAAASAECLEGIVGTAFMACGGPA
jgi:hypothetical protein